MIELAKCRSTAQTLQWNLRSRLGNLSRLRWHLEQQIRASGSELRIETYGKSLHAVELDIADVRLAMGKLPSKWKVRALVYAAEQGLGSCVRVLPGPAASFAERPPSGGGISPPDLSRSDQLV